MISAVAAALCAWLAWRPRPSTQAGTRLHLGRDAALTLITWAAFGPLAALIVVLGVRVVLPWLESRDRRVLRPLDERGALQVVTALAVCHSAGITGPAAWEAAGQALDPGARRACDRLLDTVRAGSGYDQALSDIAAAEPLLDRLCHILRRAHVTGTPAAPALHEAARQHAADVHSEVLRRVRQLGVRAALPLGLCFLPAFVLIGVVPLAAGLM